MLYTTNEGGECIMPIDRKKRLLTQKERGLWIPITLDNEFSKYVPNFQGWVLEKMKEEIAQQSEKKAE